jgi:hypothetical protein
MSIYAKLANFQKELVTEGGIKFDAVVNYGQTKFKYATLSNIIKVATPILSKNGLAFTQMLDNNKLLTKIVDAESNEEITSTIDLDLSNKKPQEIGSLLTYFKRYELSSLLGIAADEDQDAIAFTKTEKAKTANDTATTATATLDDLKKMGLSVVEDNGKIIVGGKTFEYQNLLKSMGFVFEREQKVWTKNVA